MRVLSIDGGGIRGMIPAIVLAEIERRAGRSIADLFDLVAGTSTGGILACALSRPDAKGNPIYTAEELVELYEREGPGIFDRSLLRRVTSVDGALDERYGSSGLRDALERYLGDARMSDALVPVLITAYDIEGRFAFFFRSSRAATDPTYDFSLADAAHATSAAPTYFEPVRVTDLAGHRTYPLIDGGVYAGNPAMCAYVEAAASGVDVLASLGTGSATRPIPYADARGWGQLGWARPLVGVLLSSAAETVDFQLDRLLGANYVRIQERLLTASDDLDDASAANLRDLRDEGDRFVRRNAAAIDALVARLVDPA